MVFLLFGSFWCPQCRPAGPATGPESDDPEKTKLGPSELEHLFFAGKKKGLICLPTLPELGRRKEAGGNPKRDILMKVTVPGSAFNQFKMVVG